jgi:small GTP-binding protein
MTDVDNLNLEQNSTNYSENNYPLVKIIKQSVPKNYEYLFKVALIGDSGCGKTSILLRFSEDQFKNDTSSTIGVDFKIVSVSIGEEKYAKMQIWDTCGSERFKSLTMSFIKSCPAFLLIFDITKHKTFKNIENWIEIINENIDSKLICLVGNKSDLDSERQVTYEEIFLFSEKNGLKYIEVSAKTNERIEDVFVYICEILLDEVKKRKNTQDKEIAKSRNIFDIGGFRNINSLENMQTIENNFLKKSCC